MTLRQAVRWAGIRDGLAEGLQLRHGHPCLRRRMWVALQAEGFWTAALIIFSLIGTRSFDSKTGVRPRCVDLVGPRPARRIEERVRLA